MAISRGNYGMAGHVTTEYFAVWAQHPTGGGFTNLVAAITRKIAFAQMAKAYPGCKITLHPVSKERYMEEMEQFNRWQKNAGSARGPEPIL